ncbi:hypothetical protein Fsol_00580 [Candidatus Fokinia solitaria]|uniref:Uncharacterized protein n=1 Tax=Candidatus Fokinia solitaria TaxID=1802984 RepID=A0A2U8BSQ4_9RICK|nr:hypothetical protein [Candidatus Fokinia solitaria]AWD33367.1 hypothetical protein Fsol_00580 [Candidatus Fokinia solitaria]
MSFHKMLSRSFWYSMGQKSMSCIEDTARKLLSYIDKKQFSKRRTSLKSRASSIKKVKQSQRH